MQNRSPPKLGSFPMFSSSIKGILVTIGPPRAVLRKCWPYWWDQQGRDCLLEESHLGQKWPGSDTPIVLIHWLRAARTCGLVWTLQRMGRHSFWRLTIFFVEGSLEERSEYLHGSHNYSFIQLCNLGVISPSPLSLRLNPSPCFWSFYRLNLNLSSVCFSSSLPPLPPSSCS